MKLLFAAVLAGLASFAVAQSRVPSKMVTHTNAQTTVQYGGSNLLSAGLDWIDQNWPTNTDRSLRYWTYNEETNWLSTNSYLAGSVISNNFLKGTNITGATYDPATLSWATEKEVMDFTTLYGNNTWRGTNVTDATTITYTNWTTGTSPSGMFVVTSGVVSVSATNAVILMTAAFMGRFWTSNAASISARIVGSDGTTYVVSLTDKEADASDEAASPDLFWGNGLVFVPPKATPVTYTTEAVVVGGSVDHTSRRCVRIKWSTWRLLMLRTP